MSNPKESNGPPARRSDASEAAHRVKTYLEHASSQIMAVLPKYMTAAREIQIVSAMVYRTPDLQKCSNDSILTSIIQAAELGFSLSEKLQEAWLIPRYNKQVERLVCGMQPGYRGLVKLARQSGEILDLQARIVLEGEVFEYWWDPGLHFDHRPIIDERDGLEITHVYSVAWLREAKDPSIEVMSRKQIERTRACSSSPNSPAWLKWYDEMARARVLARHTKSLPRSVLLDKALAYLSDDYESAQITPERAVTRTKRMVSRAEQMALEHQPSVPASAVIPEKQPEQVAPVEASRRDDEPVEEWRERRRSEKRRPRPTPQPPVNEDADDPDDDLGME